jgi:hypothetical protein
MIYRVTLFPVETTPRRPSLPRCLTVLSITLRHWRLMEGSEKCSADVLQHFERGVEVRRRSVNGQGAALPADITTALAQAEEFAGDALVAPVRIFAGQS